MVQRACLFGDSNSGAVVVRIEKQAEVSDNWKVILEVRSVKSACDKSENIQIWEQ